jgi:hypothetical protein
LGLVPDVPASHSSARLACDRRSLARDPRDFYYGLLSSAANDALEAIGVEPNLGYRPAIPEQNRNDLAIAALELRFPIHVHPLPGETMSRKHPVEDFFHLVTEMAPRPGEQLVPAHSHSMVAGGLLVTS